MRTERICRGLRDFAKAQQGVAPVPAQHGLPLPHSHVTCSVAVAELFRRVSLPTPSCASQMNSAPSSSSLTVSSMTEGSSVWGRGAQRLLRSCSFSPGGQLGAEEHRMTTSSSQEALGLLMTS